MKDASQQNKYRFDVRQMLGVKLQVKRVRNF